MKQQGLAELSHCITLLFAVFNYLCSFLPDSLCSLIFFFSIAIPHNEKPLHHLIDASFMPSSL